MLAFGALQEIAAPAADDASAGPLIMTSMLRVLDFGGIVVIFLLAAALVAVFLGTGLLTILSILPYSSENPTDIT